MKAFTVIILSILSCITGCATTAKYDAKLQSWQGADASDLLKTWGEPDAIEKFQSGNKMFLYTRPKHQPIAYNDRGVTGTQRIPASSNIGIKCATYFEISPSGKVVSTLSRGEECVSK